MIGGGKEGNQSIYGHIELLLREVFIERVAYVAYVNDHIFYCKKVQRQ